MVSVHVDHVSTLKYNKKLEKAQKQLDTMVIKDSTRYVPVRGGVLRNSVNLNTVIGKGLIVWKTPYAHYQFTGKDMVGVETGRHWARRFEPKEYNGNVLRYSDPEATSNWFGKAKQIHGREWTKKVKVIMKNG